MDETSNKIPSNENNNPSGKNGIFLNSKIEILPTEKDAEISKTQKNENEENDLKKKELILNYKKKSATQRLQEKVTPEEQIQQPITKSDIIPIEKNATEDKVKEWKEKEVKTLRTYRDDVANILKSQKTSLSKMVVSEKEKRPYRDNKIGEEGLSKKIPLGFMVIIIIVLFSLIAGFVGNYYINKKNNAGITEIIIPSFIFSDYQKELFLNNLNKKSIIEDITAEIDLTSIPLGQIIQLFLTIEDSTGQFVVEKADGSKLLLTTEVFLNLLETKSLSPLKRSLRPDFVFGLHSALGNNPFLIFKVKSYENAFAGMLTWEKTMFDELSFLFQRRDSKIDRYKNDFQDLIISNKDVRVLLNNEGKIEFVYAFINRETLIVANNETTLKELFKRLLNADLERKD